MVADAVKDLPPRAIPTPPVRTLVAGRGLEVALELTYQGAPATRGTRLLLKRIEVD